LVNIIVYHGWDGGGTTTTTVEIVIGVLALFSLLLLLLLTLPHVILIQLFHYGREVVFHCFFSCSILPP
jgi:hypothetical protein